MYIFRPLNLQFLFLSLKITIFVPHGGFLWLLNVRGFEYLLSYLFLQSSRRINYKGLMKDCLSIMCRLYELSTETSDNLESPYSSAELCHNHSIAAAMAFLELGKNACIAMQKLLTMVNSKKLLQQRIFKIIFYIGYDVLPFFFFFFFFQIMELDIFRKKADIQGSTTRVDGVRYCSCNDVSQ